ncbi:MAG TPA: hypothetical protein VF121_01425 [Thermoanaerobaculia bacterium]|nr:hypothetical protein [Thermoanaerobaculia bacterium]
MDFIVRIFFVGLIAFVPSQDGREITVLLLDAADGYTVSDGSSIEPHKALLLARSGGCTGDCGADLETARFLFPDLAEDAAQGALAQAIDAGAAWRLDGSDLALFGAGRSELAAPPLAILGNQRTAGESLPRSAAERKDFSWVAELEKIEPSAGAVDPDVLRARPEKGLIAARLRLRAGEISSYRLVGLQDEVPPLSFRSLKSAHQSNGYRQALTDWVAAEIRVQGDVLELSESRWDGGAGRAAALRPAGNTLELALLNVPQGHAAHAAEAQSSTSAPGPGKHFEMYYEIANMRPPNRLRPVPYIAGNERVGWTAVHRDELSSRLLEAIRLGDPRGSYEPVICPVVRFTL